jgi:ribosomal protein S18 acetylase RimI-like enzyme
MKINEIEACDTIVLRQKVLRPNFTLEECNYPGDSDISTHHLGCFINNDLSGIVSIYSRSNKDIHPGVGFQIRAMATSENARGKGIGLKLLSAAEIIAFNSEADYIWANARASAIGFYIKAGYKVFGEEFHINGVGAHFIVYRMNT